jgi:hypothetical protein
VLDITTKQALYAGLGIAITAGFASSAYSFIKRALDSRIPKK